MTDLDTYWRQGKHIALRRMPAHWVLSTPDDWHDAARSIVWLTLKTLAIAAALIVVYASSYGRM